MAQLVLAAAGAAVGSLFGMPQLGFAVGSMIGGQLAASQQHSYGPRLDDLRVTGTEYGQAIPWVQGAVRTAGQAWWASDRREMSTTTSQGKGGGPQSTTYTYEVDLLIGLTDGPIAGITRIWLNGKLVWTNLASGTDASRLASETSHLWQRLDVYTGGSTQLPDPIYEAAVGAGNAPAYRGRSCVMIEGLQLGNSGQIPNMTFEVSTSLSPSAAITRRYLNSATGVAYNTINTTGVGVPCMLSIRPTVRVGTLGSTTVRVFGLDGVLQSTGSRTSAEVYPGPQGSVFDPATGLDRFNYPVGIIDDQPVRVYNQDLAIGTSGKPCLTVGRTNHNDTGAFVDLALLLLPAGEYIGGHAMCSDGVHALLLTAPSNASAGAGVVNKWYLVRYSGGSSSLVRSGTLAAGIAIYKFGVGIVGFRQSASMLEDDLQHVWTINGSNGDVEMWRLDADGVMRLRGSLVSGSGMTTASYYLPALWAEASFAVVAIGPTFGAFRRSGDSLLTVPLADVVSALCTRAGMAAGQFDVTGLAASPRDVRALAVSQVGSARQTLEQLQAAYFFDLVVSDKLYFRSRASASVATIPYADLGAGINSAEDQPLALAVDSDLEMPTQVAVQYRNMLADQKIGSELSDRMLSGQASVLAVQLALGLLPSEAKGIADAIVADNLAGLMSTTLALPLAYCQLEPADVVQVLDEAGTTYRLRLTKRTDQGGLLQFDAVRDDAAVVASASVTDEGYTPSSAVEPLADSVFYALDIPLLRDADDGFGYYVAARGENANWPGCVIMRSGDGIEYQKAADVTSSAVLGSATTVLANWTGGWLFDEINTVNVDLGHGQLSSATRDAVISDKTLNVLLLGSEVIQFCNAALISASPNIYTVSRLLRGKQGTEWAMAGHATNERAVLLRPQGLRRVAQQSTDLNKSQQLKGVTGGKSIADALVTAFTNTGIGAKPLAPVDLRTVRDSSGGIHLTWRRRTRLAASLVGQAGASIPLGQDAEAYEIEILNGSGAVLRAIPASVSECDYTPALQITDFGAIQTSVSVKVYQIGNLGQRGYALSGTAQTNYVPVIQASTITLTGVYSAGVLITVSARGGVLAAYTTTVGDANLSGVAASLAASVNSSSNYSASSAANVVNVLGPAGVEYMLSVVVGGASHVAFNADQPAAYANPGQMYIGYVYINNFQTGQTEPIPSGVTFSLNVIRPAGSTVSVASYTTTKTVQKADVFSGLSAVIANDSRLVNSGCAFTVESSSVGYYGVFYGPRGVTDLSLTSTGQFPWGFSISVQSTGAAVVDADQSQITDAVIVGAPATGEIFEILLNGVSYSYTAGVGADAVAVAAGLAAVIDAAAAYVATSTGPNIKITGATVAVPFDYVGKMTRPLVATIA